MRIFISRAFLRFARHQEISDRDLCDAIDRAERGLIDADLGGGVIKQRIARPNEGRSGGYRSIILYRIHHLAFFVYGFAKNQKDNFDKKELKEFQELAKLMMDFDHDQIQYAIEQGKITEVKYHEKIQK